jgi:hypothetical protein
MTPPTQTAARPARAARADARAGRPGGGRGLRWALVLLLLTAGAVGLFWGTFHHAVK